MLAPLNGTGHKSEKWKRIQRGYLKASKNKLTSLLIALVVFQSWGFGYILANPMAHPLPIFDLGGMSSVPWPTLSPWGIGVGQWPCLAPESRSEAPLPRCFRCLFSLWTRNPNLDHARSDHPSTIPKNIPHIIGSHWKPAVCLWGRGERCPTRARCEASCVWRKYGWAGTSGLPYVVRTNLICSLPDVGSRG